MRVIMFYKVFKMSNIISYFFPKNQYEIWLNPLPKYYQYCYEET